MSTKIVLRPSNERGNADHGWLKTFHTFSFASYYDPSGKHDKFGSLRVINEDRVEPHTGFGTHGHKEFEIFSYIVSGELEHRDSMGNVEILKRGDVQLTSAGTGIRHSEKTHGNKQVHFLQIWTLPWAKNLTPKYFTRHFTDEEKRTNWVRVVAPVRDSDVKTERESLGPAPVQSPVTLSATILPPKTTRPHTFTGTKSYIHVIQTSGYNASKSSSGSTIQISNKSTSTSVLREGDGAYIFTEPGEELTVENVGETDAEVVLFDIEDQ